LGYRLIGVSAPVVDNEKLAKRLEKKGMKGKAAFSSQQAANLFDLYLRFGNKEFGSGAIAEPNVLIQSAYAEHTTVDGSTPTAFEDTANYWWLNNETLRVSSLGGAWALRNTRVPGSPLIDGSGVAIAILDAGFNQNSYDLVGIDPFNFTSVTSRSISRYSFLERSYNIPITGDCGTDACWHGYFVAGMAGAARANRFGMAGVSPNADMILLRIVGSNGRLSMYNAGWAVDTAVAWGADVINMSFSAYTLGAVGVPGTYLGAALQRSYNAGVINVAAAGNDNRFFNGGRYPWITYPVPAVWSTVIAVGSIERDRSKSSYSNYGSDIDIWAPGSSKLDALPDPGYGCFSNNQCAFTAANAFNSGTSIAAPLVAGAAALMKQVKPSLNTAHYADDKTS
jgi:subtilisin family serine protease